ncbi:MAG: hypothetical protein P794_03555 [Epsilonproteobacteria bacterium (ex Lamellibrachia satsuma)]|nr:MAG: hypothetical protein P794_03555 [Epsilonproteobacteria bacterium (ex Lamellibrachia satsuma)]
MKKVLLHTIILMIMSIDIYAKGDIVPVEPTVKVEDAQQNDALFKTLDGYIRFGYQHDDKSNTDLALGGKLHIETKAWNGLSAGASFYTTNSLGQHDGAGYSFFDTNNNSYSILGEAYLQGQWGNTTLKIGRQEIDTPFADTDDIGMIPDTYEAAVLINKDIADTTIILAQLQKGAGVDFDKPSKFTKINGSNNVQTFGVIYEGIQGLTASGWYYNLKDFDIDSIVYADVNYEGESNGFSYALGAQYASENYSASGTDAASIYGMSASAGYAGVTLLAAYNKSNDNAASNGFGGGPFFTSSNFMTLVEAGSDGEALLLNAEWDASDAGLAGLTLSVGKLTLTDASGTDTDELDIGVSYAFNDKLGIDAFYSDIDDKINADKFKNTRIFVNYTF